MKVVPRNRESEDAPFTENRSVEGFLYAQTRYILTGERRTENE